mmetsp:Transcript_7632/g.7007  ORF Transcript_7632/g.7007 Transcript_7632/m.7007 type:complete len:177 (+) Transcript_7632:437-967(+)
MRVERALTQVFVREIGLQIKVENLKRSLDQRYDFSVGGAFKSVDDWNYGYLDKANLKRFLRQTGHIASKNEIISIIRRFDTDGDAKVNLEEFMDGMKTAMVAHSSSSKKERQSQVSASQIITKSSSKVGLKKKISSTPMKEKKGHQSKGSISGLALSKKKRPQSASKSTGVKKQRK